MGSFNRDSRSAGGFRGGFSRGGLRGGDRGGRSSFGGGGNFDRGGDRGKRPMFKTVCSSCGKDCEVPFRPTNGKPVYCSDCFEKMGNRGQDSRHSGRSDSRAPEENQNKAQLDMIAVKLDKIIRLLEPKADTPVVAEENPEVSSAKDPGSKKAEETPKPKKAAKKSASVKNK